MLAAFDYPPFEILLFILAAVIAVGNRVVDAIRKARRQSAEEQRRRDQAEGVQLEGAPQRSARPAPVLRPPVVRRPPAPPPLPFPSPQVPPQPPPRRHPPRLQLGADDVQPDVELWRMAGPQPAPWAARPATPLVHRAAARLAQGLPGHLRDAIILREILGPPVAYRRLRR